MKGIPRLDVSCLYKQTKQASAILRVQNSDVIRAVQSRKLDLPKKTKTKQETEPILRLGALGPSITHTSAEPEESVVFR